MNLTSASWTVTNICHEDGETLPVLPWSLAKNSGTYACTPAGAHRRRQGHSCTRPSNRQPTFLAGKCHSSDIAESGECGIPFHMFSRGREPAEVAWLVLVFSWTHCVWRLRGLILDPQLGWACENDSADSGWHDIAGLKREAKCLPSSSDVTSSDQSFSGRRPRTLCSVVKDYQYEAAPARPWRAASHAPALQQGRGTFQVIEDTVQPSVVAFSMVATMAPPVDSCTAHRLSALFCTIMLQLVHGCLRLACSEHSARSPAAAVFPSPLGRDPGNSAFCGGARRPCSRRSWAVWDIAVRP